MVVGLYRAAWNMASTYPVWGALAVLVAAEIWRPLCAWSEEPRGRIAGNVAMGMLNAGLTMILPLSTVISAQWAAQHHLGLMNFVAVPAATLIAATVLLRSVATYGVHRLSHAIPLLWRVHRVHHSDTRIDLSTGFRNHPLDLAIAAPALAVATIACGLDARTLIPYEAVSVMFALWTHANVRVPDRLDRWLRILLVTPAMHFVHHTSDRAEFDTNYGDVLSLWDRLFRTYLHVSQDALVTRDYGLGNASEAEAASFVRQLRTPFSASVPVALPSEA